MLKTPTDSCVPYPVSSSPPSSPSSSSPAIPSRICLSPSNSIPSTNMIPALSTSSPLENRHAEISDSNTIETTKSLYAFQRPFINEPTAIHSFVPPSSSSLSHNPHSPIPRHHQKLFTTTYSSPCSSRVGVGLQAGSGADSNLPHPSNCPLHSQQSPQPYLRDHQRWQRQQEGTYLKKTSGSSSVFLPVLSMLAISASSVASQQRQDTLRKDNKSNSASAGGADENAIQCDDLPSPDYHSLSNSVCNESSYKAFDQQQPLPPRAPHMILRSSSSSSLAEPYSTRFGLPTDTSAFDMNIPSITLMSTTTPTTNAMQYHHYLTPGPIAMENGVDPTRLSLSTRITESSHTGGTDHNRRLDTPLLDLQEQGYAATATAATTTTGSGSTSLSPSALVHVESRHIELSIVTNGLVSGGSKAGDAVDGDGTMLVPMPVSAEAGLHRRYWQPTESVEDLRHLEEEEEEEEEEEMDQLDIEPANSTTSTTEPHHCRRVRFVEETQIIPSTRTGSKDDDDLTLIEDSEGYSSDESSDDDINKNNTTTIKSTLPEFNKTLQFVESILSLEEQPPIAIDSTEKQRIHKNDTSAPIPLVNPMLTRDPSTVLLSPSPNPSDDHAAKSEKGGGCGYDHDVVSPCSPTVLLPPSLVTAISTAASFDASLTESYPVAAATPKTTLPPTITTTMTTSHKPTTTNNQNNITTCTSPRTLELLSVRSQLHYWTETATLLRDQEQALTLHIDQLVQVMADVIEKCQQTEDELLEQRGILSELRAELEKEREIGFVSIQEAALSNMEKQSLEIALKELQKEIEFLKRTRVQQQSEFDEERRHALSLSLQLAHSHPQTPVQIQDEEKTHEQEHSLVAQGPKKDIQEDWKNAKDMEDQVEKEKNNQEQLQQPLQQVIEEILLETNNSNYDTTILESVPAPIASSTPSPFTTTNINNKTTSDSLEANAFKALPHPPKEENSYSFYSILKILFLVLTTTFVVVSITLLFLPGYQHHHLYQLFIRLRNTITSLSLSLSLASSGKTSTLLQYLQNYGSMAATGGLKDLAWWVKDIVPGSVVGEARALVEDLAFLANVVGGSFGWGRW